MTSIGQFYIEPIFKLTSVLKARTKMDASYLRGQQVILIHIVVQILTVLTHSAESSYKSTDRYLSSIKSEDRDQQLLVPFAALGLVPLDASANYSDSNFIPEEFEDDNDDYNDPFRDGRIDAAPTFVSGMERFAGALVAPIKYSLQMGKSGGGGGDFPTGRSRGMKQLNLFGRAAQRTFNDVLNAVGERFKAIYPGTEWCGAGSLASSLDQVGLFKNTDKCCRAHDLCKMNLGADQVRFGLVNNGIFTRSHCECDSNFYRCLKKTRSLIAGNIGVTYFNVLRPQCFKLEYPARCVKYEKARFRNNKCVLYEFDVNYNKTWQWFDNPDFI
ncbi:uncharacterized protein LOC106651910 [Trichogramma pretiosum]|uniref:uncharacterized protein LOC106651910 n=1 Tax=Trichogramma pretiosum TaxID=7493 RepID=UPI0006C9BA37|nr:uncharacterized protein LOC106651910 [Trichogramma pretiosum]